MEVWQELYGADADGNRGQLTTFAELDESDTEDIIENIYGYFVDGKTSGVVEIEIDGFTFDIDIEDYIDELIERAGTDKDVEVLITSNCCGEAIIENTKLCSKCKEQCKREIEVQDGK